MNGGAGETDTFAAEFVLGTLDADERRAANQLLASDEGFADRVRLWERRLGELHLMVEPVEPASDIWPRIKARMPEVRQFAEMMEPEPEPAEPEPEPKPEPHPEAHAEPEWQAETALEPEPELRPEAKPAELQLETESELEPELKERQAEASSVPEDTFESLIAALKKPGHKEAAAQSEQPIAPPAAESQQPITPLVPAGAPAPVPPPTWHLPPEQTEELPVAPPAAPAAALPAGVPAPVPTPSWHLPSEQTEELPIAPAPPFVAPAPAEQIEKVAEPVLPQSGRKAQRSITRWRIMAVLLFIVLAAMAGLVAAWRFIPDRIPPALQPVELMRLAGIPVPVAQPPRKPPPPPESTFEE
jgi:hypothetical protein